MAGRVSISIIHRRRNASRGSKSIVFLLTKCEGKNMKRNIYLIGFMGVGKSTIGKILANKMQGKLIEMDEAIETEQGKSINEIFATYGEEYFRDLESKLVERIATGEGNIVSCGGGAVLRPENVECMKKSGTIVFLSATPETIYKRVRYSTNRPLLNGNMNVAYIAGLMEKRRALYESAADITIDTDGKSKGEIVRDLLSKYE
jgi:shikimate kinase